MFSQNKPLTVSLIVVAALLQGCAGPSTVPVNVDRVAVQKELEIQRQLALDNDLAQRNRLSSLSQDLLKAAVPLCEDQTNFRMGIFVNGPRMYPKNMQDYASEYLNLDPETIILAGVVRGSPADKAGLQTGDKLVSLNGEELKIKKPSLFGIAAPVPIVKPVNELVIERQQTPITLQVEATEACNYPIHPADNSEINAYTDGTNIFVNTGLMNAFEDKFVRSVIAHEIAHNVMDHIEKQQQNIAIGLVVDILIVAGTGTDIRSRNIAGLIYSKEFEAEADYVGMYLYARAGYSIEEPQELWRIMGSKVSKGSTFSTKKNWMRTHPSTPDRFVAMDETINEIKAKQAANEELLPNFKE